MTKLNIYCSSTDESINPIYQTNSIGMSEKYQKQSSTEIIDMLDVKGFSLVGTSFGKPRKQEKIGFQKHVMCFEHNSLTIDDENKMQLLVTNSHDGSSSLKFDIGIFRAVCANGLVVGNSLFSAALKHIGDNFNDKLTFILNEVLQRYPIVKENVNKMQSTTLNDEQIKMLVEAAAKLRLSNIENISGVYLNTLLKLRRYEDQKRDLYTVFNVIQENVVKGGLKYKTQEVNRNDLGDVIHQSEKMHTCRAIKSVDSKMQLNKNLWDISMKLAA